MQNYFKSLDQRLNRAETHLVLDFSISVTQSIVNTEITHFRHTQRQRILIKKTPSTFSAELCVPTSCYYINKNAYKGVHTKRTLNTMLVFFNTTSKASAPNYCQHKYTNKWTISGLILHAFYMVLKNIPNSSK